MNEVLYSEQAVLSPDTASTKHKQVISSYARLIALALLPLLLFTGCGKVRELEDELVRTKQQHSVELSELAVQQETALAAKYEEGRKAGFVEGLDEQGEKIYTRGINEGHQMGLAEGRKEVKVLQDKEAERIREHRNTLEELRKDQTSAADKEKRLSEEIASLKAKLRKSESDNNGLQQRIEAVLTERADLIEKLRAAIARIDLYEVQTKDRED